MEAVEEAYNSLYDPKLYFEVDKKCSEDLKKLILDKLKGTSTQAHETSVLFYLFCNVYSECLRLC